MGHKPGLYPICPFVSLSVGTLTKTHANVSNPGKVNQRLCRNEVEGERDREGEGEEASRS